MLTKKELEVHIAELEAEVSALKTEKYITETVMASQVEKIHDLTQSAKKMNKHYDKTIEGLHRDLDKALNNFDNLYKEATRADEVATRAYEIAIQQRDKYRSRNIKKMGTAKKAHDTMLKHFFALYAEEFHRNGLPLKRGVLKRLREETAQWAFDKKHTSTLLKDKGTLRGIMPDVVKLAEHHKKREQ